MADYVFETMTQGDAEAFTNGDTLRFSSTAATPANVVFSANGLGAVSVTSGTTTLQFNGEEIANAPIEFVSSFLAAVDSTAYVGSNSGNSLTQSNEDAGNYYYGFGGNDTIDAGDGGGNFLYGGTGEDRISVGDGGDNAFGGAGADSIRGGDEGDHLYGYGLTGTVGNDTTDVDTIRGNDGNDYIQGNAGADSLFGGNDRDRILGGADNDTIDGGNGNDTLNGNKGDDTLYGQDDNDSIRGGQGDDALFGNDGNDVLLGDLGDDEINGGAGLDVLTGGDGNDLFVFDSGDAAFSATGDFKFVTDIVTDFVAGSDQLSIGLNVTEEGENLILQGEGVTFTTFEAAQTYAQQLLTISQDDNDVAAIQVGADTYVFYDSDTSLDTEINSAIKLVGVTAADLTVDDFASIA
ncbi:MAG: calcium-binding protein [Pseudomonadota bacterium]